MQPTIAQTKNPSMKKVKILNVQFDVCSKDEALARIFDFLLHRRSEAGKQIATPNPEMLLEAQKNPLFRDTLNKTFLNIPDGIGILWASTFQEITKRNTQFMRYLKGFFSLLSLIFYPKFCRKIFPERISGVDLMESICAISAGQHVPIFLLGGQPGVADKVREILHSRYPKLRIVGTFSGSPYEDDFPAIQAQILETQPAVLFVAYGAPKQELWIARHLPQLPSIRIAMGIGGAFDFLAGTKNRAPKWMQRLGLEWLYRLIQEPSRLRRIWNATIKFPLTIIKS